MSNSNGMKKIQLTDFQKKTIDFITRFENENKLQINYSPFFSKSEIKSGHTLVAAVYGVQRGRTLLVISNYRYLKKRQMLRQVLPWNMVSFNTTTMPPKNLTVLSLDQLDRLEMSYEMPHGNFDRVFFDGVDAERISRSSGIKFIHVIERFNEFGPIINVIDDDFVLMRHQSRVDFLLMYKLATTCITKSKSGMVSRMLSERFFDGAKSECLMREKINLIFKNEKKCFRCNNLIQDFLVTECCKSVLCTVCDFNLENDQVLSKEQKCPNCGGGFKTILYSRYMHQERKKLKNCIFFGINFPHAPLLDSDCYVVSTTEEYFNRVSMMNSKSKISVIYPDYAGALASVDAIDYRHVDYIFVMEDVYLLNRNIIRSFTSIKKKIKILLVK